MDTSPRVLFIGGTPRGQKVFELLLDQKVNLVGLVALEEDAHEESKVSIDLKARAAETGAHCWVTKRIDEALEARILELRPELIIVVGWRTMISRKIYELPSLGCVGVHDSPLPRYRGFAPVNWAVINGERQWGVSFMHIGEGVDEGDLVGQVNFPVAERVTARELYEQVTEATVQVVSDCLSDLLAGTSMRTPQDHTQATYACSRTPVDGEIDWTWSTLKIDRLIRGLGRPYPGATTTWKGESVRIWDAEPVVDAPIYEGRIPGRVVGFAGGGVDVLTGDGVLRIHRVQVADSGEQVADQAIRSVKNSLGR